jgi:tryptophan synthase alpha chain
MENNMSNRISNNKTSGNINNINNRIDAKFAELRNNGRKALIAFITAGDPDVETTIQIAKQLEQHGVDLIELGIPYSDPIAEGPVIQRANERALKNKIKIKDVMNAVKVIRQNVNTPLLYLLYYNCILQYGQDKFFSDCKDAGIDGVIVPDLPYEEQDEIEDACAGYSIYSIAMVSPISRERVEKIVKSAKGFIYCVSSLGVTGIRNKFDTDFKEFFSYINAVTNIPKAIGFGISTPEQVQMLKNYCDGIIVGSAIVKKIEESGDLHETLEKIGTYVSKLRNALDS